MKNGKTCKYTTRNGVITELDMTDQDKEEFEKEMKQTRKDVEKAMDEVKKALW
jgi:uncharacterized protein (DUF3084 family)